MSHKVSILIPAHNERESIGRTLDSIYNSNQDNLEVDIKVCCNSCTDGTEEIVSKYPVQILQEPKRGKAFALNKLLNSVRGSDTDYFCFVDSDVRVGKDSIALLVETLNNSNLLAAGAKLEPDVAKMNFSQQMSTMPFRLADYKYMPGALYVARPEAFEGIEFPHEIILDDVWISMKLDHISINNNAPVYFFPPATFNDFWNQTKRRMAGIYQLKEHFSHEAVENMVPNNIIKTLQAIDTEKLNRLNFYEKMLFLISIPVYAAMKKSAYSDYKKGRITSIWESQESTKKGNR